MTPAGQGRLCSHSAGQVASRSFLRSQLLFEVPLSDGGKGGLQRQVPPSLRGRAERPVGCVGVGVHARAPAAAGMWVGQSMRMRDSEQARSRWGGAPSGPSVRKRRTCGRQKGNCSGPRMVGWKRGASARLSQDSLLGTGRDGAHRTWREPLCQVERKLCLQTLPPFNP